MADYAAGNRVADDRREAARARAAAADERVRQLNQRIMELRSGGTPAEEDLLRAQRAARAAAELAAQAHEHARAAHLSAAQLHETVAAFLDGAGHHEAAKRHRLAAEAERPF
jgi:hypothetical protein